MTERRALRWAPLAGMAGAGVIAGHWISYVLAIPPAGLREQILAQTGHSYWEFAVKLVTVLAVVGLGAVVAANVGDRVGVDRSRVQQWSFVAGRLIILQVLGFTGMEVAERFAAGAPLGGMFAHNLLLLGLGVQILTAVVAASLLTWFERGVVRLVAAIRRRTGPSSRTRARVPGPAWVFRPSLVLAGAAGLRGPPRA